MTDELTALRVRVAGDPECPYCTGTGERFWHAADCRSDDCALAGGIDDCNGVVEPCPCAAPTPDPRDARIAVLEAALSEARDALEHIIFNKSTERVHAALATIDRGLGEETNASYFGHAAHTCIAALSSSPNTLTNSATCSGSPCRLSRSTATRSTRSISSREGSTRS